MSNPITPDNTVFISVTPTNIAIAFGTTVQLVPVLTDVGGNTLSATKPFIYSSSNTALATVDSSGLVTAYTPADPNVLNVGGVVQITVTYPYSNRTDNETVSATSVIKILATPATSIFTPAAPGVSGGDSTADFTYLENHTAAHYKNAGWKVVPKP
jgi:Bacterial Ig-like domain (group 2)